ncbi:MAG: hypothetical protein HYW90_01430 [Candidatus Sungbacteria bacterium]|nr:hypothetical protein [Candidatus Sungbacteria bacterium]
MLKKELTFLFAILVVGAFFRFYLLPQIPPGLFIDEAMNGNNAVESLETGDFKLFYPENNGREGLFINLQAVALWLLGLEPWVLRLVSAIFGMLTILGIYLLTKELFKNYELGIRNRENKNKNHNSLFMIPDSTIVALLSAFFLATSYWHINFSRIGFRAILVPFFTTFGLYWLIKGLRTGKFSSIVCAGIFIGLGFHTYPAFRLMLFVIALPLIFAFTRWMRKSDAPEKPCTPCAIALFILTVLLVVSPLVLYFVKNPSDFFARSSQVSVFASERPVYEFAKSNLLTFQMFFWKGDCNPRHNYDCQPELNPMVSFFFLAGIIVAFRVLIRNQESGIKNQGGGERKNPDSSFPIPDSKKVYTLLLAWLFFMSLPATLTREGLPHALRAIGMIPPVMILSALGATTAVKKAFAALEKYHSDERFKNARRQIERIRRETAILFFLILIFIPIYTYQAYFLLFPTHPNTVPAFSADLENMGRYLASLPSETEKFVIVNHSDVLIRGIPAAAQVPMFFTKTFSETERTIKKMHYVLSAEEIAFGQNEKVVIIPMDASVRRDITNKFPGMNLKPKDAFISFENF